MRRVVYLRGARRELSAILVYLTRASGDAMIGRAFVQGLRSQCRHLASLPGQMGRPRPELAAGLRSFVHRGYVIFFRYIDDRFEVVTVLEGHRDIDGHFFEERPL